MTGGLKASGLSKWFGRGVPPAATNNPAGGIWALADVNFTIQPGESVGLVGPNGAGKTTLLRLAAGVLTPTRGTIALSGRVSSVLELTAPFSAVLSGAENLRLALLLRGIPEDRMEIAWNEAASFSGLGDRLGKPLATYSQGMILRLGFAAATVETGDILLLDEVLLVGDEEFQIKCNRKIASILDRGTSVIFASHDLYRVEHMCRRTLWLESGRLMADGPSGEVIDTYQRSAGDRRQVAMGIWGLSGQWVNYQPQHIPVQIRNFRLFGRDRVQARQFQTGGWFGFELDSVADGTVADYDLFFYVHREDGIMISQFAYPVRGAAGRTMHVEGCIDSLPLVTGNFGLNVAVIPEGLLVGYHDPMQNRRVFAVNNSKGDRAHRSGVVTLPVIWNPFQRGGSQPGEPQP
ncbi:MAG: ABC transporter ATP-binding protein [Deltaproteobacteria bacterium]|nr:ABC transporter ATP-binding protein [Deltaproteobacteria bacterium]